MVTPGPTVVEKNGSDDEGDQKGERENVEMLSKRWVVVQ